MGVITASDTRHAASDESGRLIREMLEGAGHRVTHYEVLPDTPERIAEVVRERLRDLDGIIVNGGTGIAPRDSTIEALRLLRLRARAWRIRRRQAGPGHVLCIAGCRYSESEQNIASRLFRRGQ